MSQLFARMMPFDADRFDKACEMVADGMVRDDALKAAGIPRMSFRHWLHTTPELNYLWTLAKEAGALACDALAQRTIDNIGPNTEHMVRGLELKARQYRARAAALHPVEHAVLRELNTPNGRQRRVRADVPMGAQSQAAAALIAASPSDD